MEGEGRVDRSGGKGKGCFGGLRGSVEDAKCPGWSEKVWEEGGGRAGLAMGMGTGLGGAEKRDRTCGDVEAEGPALGRGQHTGQRGGLRSPMCVGDGESGGLQSRRGEGARSGAAPRKGPEPGGMQRRDGWGGGRPGGGGAGAQQEGAAGMQGKERPERRGNPPGAGETRVRVRGGAGAEGTGGSRRCRVAAERDGARGAAHQGSGPARAAAGQAGSSRGRSASDSRLHARDCGPGSGGRGGQRRRRARGTPRLGTL